MHICQRTLIDAKILYNIHYQTGRNHDYYECVGSYVGFICISGTLFVFSIVLLFFLCNALVFFEAFVHFVVIEILRVTVVVICMIKIDLLMFYPQKLQDAPLMTHVTSRVNL